MSGSISFNSDLKTLTANGFLQNPAIPGSNTHKTVEHTAATALQSLTASPATAAAGTEPLPPAIATSYANSNATVAEALKALAPLFNDNFIESSKPIKLEQLYFLTLEKVIEVSYIGLLVSMLKKAPFNRKSFSSLQALMTSLSGNNWKTSTHLVGTPILTKQFLELAKILGLAKDVKWLNGFLKLSAVLSTLTKQSKEHALPCSNADIHPSVIFFMADLQHKYGKVVFIINQQIREKQLSFLEEISDTISNLNTAGLKKLSHKLYKDLEISNQTEFSKKKKEIFSLKSSEALVQDLEKLFCKLKDSCHRICYCSGIIMENLQKQCLILIQSSKPDNFPLDEFNSLGMRFHLGYKKRIEALQNELINYENYNILCKSGYYYSDNSKNFSKTIHRQLEHLWTLFTKDLIEKLKAVPQIEAELNFGSIEQQTTRSQRLSDTIGFYIYKCLWKKSTTWTDKSLRSSHLNTLDSVSGSRFEEGYEILALKSQIDDPRIEGIVEQCCDEFFKHSSEISKKMGIEIGTPTSLFANILSITHETMLFANSSSACKEFSSEQSPERLKKAMQALETNAADIFFKTLFLFLKDSNAYDEYNPENLKLHNDPTGIIQLCLEAGTDLDLLGSAESLRKTLMTLFMSCQQKRQKATQTTLTAHWMESVDEQNKDDFELDATEQVNLQSEKDKKSNASNAKFEPQGIAKTIDKNAIKSVVLSYPSRSDRLLALFRYNLGSVYNLPTGLVPAAMAGQVINVSDIAMHQQLLAAEGIQAIREMQGLLANDTETVKFLEKFLSLYEHLSIEQGLTVHDVEKFPDLDRTHRLDILSERLKLNTAVDLASRSIMGTCQIRYPHSYAAWEKAFDEKNAKANPMGIEDRIKKLVEVQSTTLEKFSTVASQQFANLWKQSEAQATLQKEAMSTGLSKEHATKLDVAAKHIQESKSSLEKYISTLPINTVNERKTIEALKNVLEHLNNLHKLAIMAPQFANERFLFVQAHMGTLSSQYLAENLGACLSLKDGSELRNHNLLLYYLSHGLGAGLSAEEWETFIAINVLKGSEYPFNYFAKRSKKQISSVMNHLSALYGASTQARAAIETGVPQVSTISPQEMQKTFVDHLVKQVELCTSLLSYHLN